MAGMRETPGLPLHWTPPRVQLALGPWLAGTVI